MNSMTGFAQRHFNFDRFSVSISLKTLNHKYLDIYFKGNGIPPMIEKIFRDTIKQKLRRGKVEVGFEVLGFKPDEWKIHLDEALLKRVLGRIARIQKEFGDTVHLSLDHLLKIPMIFQIESSLQQGMDDHREHDQLNSALREVLEDLIAGRRREGGELAEVITDSLSAVDRAHRELEKQATDIQEEINEKYLQKIRRFVKDYEIDERRIIQEAAIIADKSCITEEIERIKVHANRLRSIITDTDDSYSKGKEMDFITQEILRETHTIGAKTSQTAVQNSILAIRREIEKIRQQVQNVE